MARPLRVEYPHAFYHTTARGNEKGRLFSTDRDRDKFLGYLKDACKRFGLVVHAYCLMLNHYHLLCETPLANLSAVMHFINSGYAAYYNTKWKRVGHLFQGRFKSILVDTDSYMRSLSRYIHLNPVRAKLVRRPQDYEWSSYKYYINSRKAPDFLNVDFTLGFFDKSRAQYKSFVEEGLAAEEDSPLKDVSAGFILGSEKFVNFVKDKYLGDLKPSRDLAGLRVLRKRESLEKTITDFFKKDKSLAENERMKLMVYFLRKRTAQTLGAISARATDGRLSISAVSQIVLRLDRKRKANAKVEKKLKALEGELSNV